MKENQIEFMFIGVIILFFAIWKISELIKGRCRRGMMIEGFKQDTDKKATAMAPEGGDILSEVTNLIKKSPGVEPFFHSSPILSTENFTVDTTENEMTVHQRKKIAPVPAVVAPVAPAHAPTSTW